MYVPDGGRGPQDVHVHAHLPELPAVLRRAADLGRRHGVNATALAVLVLRLTDSGVALGVQSALLFLPVLLFGVLGGTFADRFDKRRILLWANVGYAVLAGLLFVLVATDVVQMWMVYAISALERSALRDRAADPSVVLRGARRRAAHHERRQSQQRGDHGHPRARRRDRGDDDPGVRSLVAVLPGRRLLRRGDRALLAMRVDELHLHRRAERERGLAWRDPVRARLARAPDPVVRDAGRVPVHVQLQRAGPAPRASDLRRVRAGRSACCTRRSDSGRSSGRSRWPTGNRRRPSDVSASSRSRSGRRWRSPVSCRCSGWRWWRWSRWATRPRRSRSRRTRRCSGSPAPTCADG